MGVFQFSLNYLTMSLLIKRFSQLSCCLIITNDHEPDTLSADPQNGESKPSYYLRQLQLLKLFDNIVCIKDDDVRQLSESFDPMKNLNMYTNPQDVQSYFEGLKSGKYLRRGDPFTSRVFKPGDPKPNYGQLFLILLAIDDWELFYKTCVYALARVNMETFFFVLKVLVSSKYAHEHFQTPPTNEVLPQLFAPKSFIYSYNGVKELQQTNLTNGEEDKLNYYKNSPTFNAFHTAWHNDFPSSWRYPQHKFLKDRKGELFLYMHRQLVNRYRAERLSVGGTLGDVSALKLDEEIATGYVSDVLDGSFREIPARYNNTRLVDSNALTIQLVLNVESTLRGAISQGMLQNENGSHISLRNNEGYDILGATIEPSEDSASQKLYKSFHGDIHELICIVRDPIGSEGLPRGVIFTELTALRDPVFFHIHTLIDGLYTLQSHNLKQYNEDNLRLEGVDLMSVKITGEGGNEVSPHSNEEPYTPALLETFYEDFSFDISNGIMFCDKPPLVKEATATIKRHNHKPFQYSLEVHSSTQLQTNATVRIYMSPTKGYNGEVYSDEQLYANMFEMDRFPVTLSQGKNTIIRSSRDSAVTVPEPKPLKQLLKKTEEALAAGKQRQDYDEPYRHCGYPHHLLVPKGTTEGQSFKMFVIVTKNQPQLHQRSYPGLVLCGVETGPNPDKETMGFPFDRKINFKLSKPQQSHHQSYKFLDVIVRLNDDGI